MKRIVDIYRKDHREHVLWTYIITLGGDGSHPSLEDFRQEGLRLAALDKRGHIHNLDAYVHLKSIN